MSIMRQLYFFRVMCKERGGAGEKKRCHVFAVRQLSSWSKRTTDLDWGEFEGQIS